MKTWERILIGIGLLVALCVVPYGHGNSQDVAPTIPRVIVLAPQSGSSAYFGKVVANGIVLSLKAANGEVEYRVLDDKSDPIAVVGLIQEAQSWGAVTIIGPLDSDVAAAAAAEAQRMKIPLISPCATASHLTETGNQWFFRANTSDRQRADELASWSTEIIARRGVLIVNEARSEEDIRQGRAPLYGEALATDLLRALNGERQPASAVTFQRDGFDDATRQAIVDRVREGAVGGVAVLCRSKEAVAITEFVRSRFRDLPVFLISPGRDQFSQSQVKDGVYAVTDTAIEVTQDRVLEEFRRRYSLEFPGQPSPTQQCATFGYDAGEIVIAAIKRSRQRPSTTDIGVLRSTVRDELMATPNDRQGLVSVGGFTKQQELNFRPHRVVLRMGAWVEEGNLSRQDTFSVGRIIMYFGILLVFLALVMGLFVWQLPRLHRFNDRIVTFVISAVVGLIAALITFGVLRSYGQVSGKSLGIAFEFGGPAALFIGVLVLGTRVPKRDTNPFTVTVILHEAAHGRGVVPVSGKITFLLPKEARQETVTSGQAVVEGLDAQYKNISIDYVLSVPGYALTPNAVQLRLTPDAVLYIRIRKAAEPTAIQSIPVKSVHNGDSN